MSAGFGGRIRQKEQVLAKVPSAEQMVAEGMEGTAFNAKRLKELEKK